MQDKKFNLKHLPLIIQGSGPINENQEISLTEYIPQSNLVPVQLIPQRISFSLRKGKTVYDVSSQFDVSGNQTLLQQFKNLILLQSQN